MNEHNKEDLQSTSQKKWENIEEKHKTGVEQPAEKKSEQEGIEFPTRQQLENQLTELERQASDYKEKMLRAHADMDNLRRRSEREIANAAKYSTDRLLEDLLPVMDSLTRALDNAGLSAESKGMREGIALTLDLFLRTLTRHGVEPIDPKAGDLFDPQLHEALSMQKQAGAKPNTILQTVQKGYQLHSRVLRAAMVIVAGE